MSDVITLLVTSYSEKNEQHANQFIEGCLDPRPVLGLARALAKLLCSDLLRADGLVLFNEHVRPCVLDLMREFRSTKLDEVLAGGSRFSKLAREIDAGWGSFKGLLEKSVRVFEEMKDCL